MRLSVSLQNAVHMKLKQLFNPAFKCSKFSHTKLTFMITEKMGTEDALPECFTMLLRPYSDLNLQCPSSCIPPLSV